MASAWGSRVRKLPSQPRRKLSAALKTVGVLKGSSDPSRALSRRFAVGAIGADVVTGDAGARPVTRQARIRKEALAKSELPGVGVRRRRYRRYRLLRGRICEAGI